MKSETDTENKVAGLDAVVKRNIFSLCRASTPRSSSP